METKVTLGTIAFIGMGLIGGSLALALRSAGVVTRIIALDSSSDALNKALEMGVIDASVGWQELEQADIIVLATPVDALYAISHQLKNAPLKSDVVVTDVGSTKNSVLAAMRQAFGIVPRWFVPAHPIAGREHSGVEAAQADLFLRHKVILTALAETDDRSLGIVSRMWLATGAFVSHMPVLEHDEILGATSHLPHVLAYLLVDMLDQDLHHEEIFNYAAGGFRDFTRIASSSPVMWRDICINNADVLCKLLEKYCDKVRNFENLLQTKDVNMIEQIFMRAKAARDIHIMKE